MLTGLSYLALEVKYLDPAASFYRDTLALDAARADDDEVAFDAGGTDLVLRRPSTVPRGGLHVHYAVGTGEYDRWRDRLSSSFDLHEEQFGDARSLYFYDTDGNCVELGERGEGSLDGVFEVVLEVEDLDRALSFYRALGFEVVDRGERRRRVRLTAGPFDLELWEPQLGLADARGGVHVDVGVEADDPGEAANAVSDMAGKVEVFDGAVRVKDPDGHYLTFS